MLLKYFYDSALAHASYLVGCQRTGEAIVIDPGRSIDQYLEAAAREGLKITAATETHIHADFVSGSRELAERVGAKLFLSDTGPADWKYLYTKDYAVQLVVDGDTFSVGNVDFQVLHTPGHTPESISFVLTDRGGGATKPMGIFTGDFVFVGAVGRPDLLEEAAGVVGSARAGAHQLYHSVQKFRELPDHLQVWPAHGAGSACGKGLGAIPSSTVGYEKLFNPALQYDDEEQFVEYILADQPEAPKYFAVMKRVNKEGPQVLGETRLPSVLPADKLSPALDAATVVDVSPSKRFAEAHVPGSLNIPLNMLAGWAGWVVDYSKPVYLIAEVGQLADAVRILRSIGIDDIPGYFERSEVHAARLATESYDNELPQQVQSRIDSGEVVLIDVRAKSEWNRGHIAAAEHHFLGRLPDQLDQLPADKPIVTQCQGGVRSAIAASILQAAGRDVINLDGGFAAWQKAGLEVTQPGEAACGVGGVCAS